MTDNDLYALNEADKDAAPFKVTLSDAHSLNDRGFGIFWSVNEFGNSRKATDLVKIRAWHVDIDTMPKKDQLKLINSSPIYPSLVIESKNGYHVYFKVSSASTFTHKYILKGLCKYFCGDEKVAIVTALLRAPGFLHWKDKESPFMVKEIFSRSLVYSESQMRYFFPFTMKPKTIGEDKTLYNKPHIGPIENLTEFLDNLDCEYGLRVLSGTHYVNNEVYTFKPVGGGKLNIQVNGKGTSCFIDSKKKIGAVPGGPTLWTWLKYYGHSDKRIFAIINERFT